MHILPQEDWSPELLSELQRAVPVLESSSFDFREDDGNGELSAGDSSGWASSNSVLRSWHASHNTASGLGLTPSGPGGSGRLTEGGLRWGGWAMEGGSAALRGPGIEGPPAGLLSDDAMALPMSTLTSGKRRTYPNKSTFQAHVCCVMDPLQVQRVLETLQASPHFKSVRHWPHAYRIISPFDGQTHEGSNDDQDPGAGEKMLGLLTRMGLENLLLIISRWDSGPADRLGAELFRCVNEQCKDLLRELQQAVRASFPPEELLGPTRQGLAAGGKEALVLPGAGASGAGSGAGAGGGEASEGEDEDFGTSVSSSDNRGSPRCGSGGQAAAARLIDLRPIGMTPPAELLHASRGICALPLRRPHRREASEDEGSPSRKEAGDQGLQGQRCQVAVRGDPSSSLAAARKQPGAAGAEAGSGCVGAQGGASAVSLNGAPSAESLDVTAQRVAECGVGGLSALTMSRMRSEELLRLGAHLRVDRRSLEEELGGLGQAEDIIKSLHLPLFEGESAGDGDAKGSPLRSSVARGAPAASKDAATAASGKKRARRRPDGKRARSGAATART